MASELVHLLFFYYYFEKTAGAFFIFIF